jgi:hypothetical protein
MKLRFLHDSMYFNQETAQEQHIKKGQTVDIPEIDVNAFISGDNPRAEIVSEKEKATMEKEGKALPVVETKEEPVATKKAKPRTTKKAKK